MKLFDLNYFTEKSARLTVTADGESYDGEFIFGMAGWRLIPLKSSCSIPSPPQEQISSYSPAYSAIKSRPPLRYALLS